MNELTNYVSFSLVVSGVGGVVAILLVLFLIVLITSGFIYAYMNPQSRPGIWLIEVNITPKFSVFFLLIHIRIPFWGHLYLSVRELGCRLTFRVSDPAPGA